MRRLIVFLILLMAGAAPACARSASQSASQSASRFDGWAAAVISADWRDSRDRPIEAFDNARRDLTAGFLAAGFSRANLYDASLRPDVASPVMAGDAIAAMTTLTRQAGRGCMLYFTSHGAPEGMVFGPDETLTPTAMAMLVREMCGSRPTVLIVSACYSGIFVDALAAPNRMILTAARRDRSSFGCGADVRYPYFDGCVIESLPTAGDFIALANATRACVRRRETDEDLTPSSEPQLSIGGNMQLLLPTLRFTRPTPAPTP